MMASSSAMTTRTATRARSFAFLGLSRLEDKAVEQLVLGPFEFGDRCNQGVAAAPIGEPSDRGAGWTDRPGPAGGHAGERGRPVAVAGVVVVGSPGFGGTGERGGDGGAECIAEEARRRDSVDVEAVVLSGR